jgi:hypothetical protein
MACNVLGSFIHSLTPYQRISYLARVISYLGFQFSLFDLGLLSEAYPVPSAVEDY